MSHEDGGGSGAFAGGGRITAARKWCVLMRGDIYHVCNQFSSF